MSTIEDNEEDAALTSSPQLLSRVRSQSNQYATMREYEAAEAQRLQIEQKPKEKVYKRKCMFLGVHVRNTEE